MDSSTGTDYDEEEYLVSEDEMLRDDPIPSTVPLVAFAGKSNIGEESNENVSNPDKDATVDKKEKLFSFTGIFSNGFSATNYDPEKYSGTTLTETPRKMFFSRFGRC